MQWIMKGSARIHLMMLAGMGTALAAILLDTDSRSLGLSGVCIDALGMTVATLTEVLFAMVIFMLVFYIVIHVLSFLYGKTLGRRSVFIGFVSVGITILLGLNAFPIVYYMRFFQSIFPEHDTIVRISALLMANAMLYYFIYVFISELWAESKKLYVISAPFKGEREIDYLRETAQWRVLVTLRPLFYYLLSFTLFAEAILPMKAGEASGKGIVGELFYIVFHEGFNLRFWTAFLSMMMIVLPVRVALDIPPLIWQKKRHLAHEPES